MHTYQIYIVYTLNIYNFIYQYHFSKVGGGWKMKPFSIFNRLCEWDQVDKTNGQKLSQGAVY